MLASALLPVARLKRRRFVHWVQDIHPEVASRVGPIPRSGPASATLRTLSRMSNRAADLSVTIGPAMADHLVQEGAPHDRVRVIPNWIDTAVVRPLVRDGNPLAEELGVAGKFIILYSGNAGRAHPMDAVVVAMQQLRNHDDVAFVFIGGGPGHMLVKQAAADAGVRNARFLDYLPRERIAESHSMAHVCLVTETADVAGLLYPSKATGILAAARPLVFVGSAASEVAALVGRHDCGLVIPPGDGAALARAILKLHSDSAERERLGENGRRAAIAEFDVQKSCAAWEAALLNLLHD